MQNLIQYPSGEEPQPLPAELLKLYRLRSGLTQVHLANLLGLKNERMIRNWEGGYHLPGPQRLQKLIEIYLLRQVFLPQQEQTEARQLWDRVKAGFATDSAKPEYYPPFDENWFEQLPRQGFALKTPLTIPISTAPAYSSDNLTGPDLTPPSPQPKRQDNLPHSPNRFVGREKELNQALGLLTDTTTRLLTFTGPGGAGKTRLALETASRLCHSQHFSQGVWLVELAQLSDPRLILQAVTEVLGVKEVAGRPLLAEVLAHLQGKVLLLVLDNCEHLVEECARLSQTLTQACSGLQILATSREGLDIPAEIKLEILGLAFPDTAPSSPALLTLENLVQVEAINLFVERASATQANFSLRQDETAAVLQICQRLDGLPLALELAAAQVKVLGVKQIAERLYQLPLRGGRAVQPRQQTIRASIEWSYTLLNEQEQQLLQRLGVFRGGWGLEAVEVVCSGAGLEAFEMLGLMTQLVNKSLVVAHRPEQAGEVRYRLLETIRQYSEEKAREAQLYERYQYRQALFYLAFTEKAVPKLLGEQQDEWLWRLEQEQDNLRMALGWLLEQNVTAPQTSLGFNDDPFLVGFSPQLPELALRLAGAMWRIWFTQGRFTEGRHWLDAALLITPANPTREIAAVRAKVLRDASSFAWLQGESELSRSLAQESIELYRDLEDKAGLAYALISLATGWLLGCEYAQTIRLLEESLSLFEELGDQRGLALTQHNLGWATLFEGNTEGAVPLLQQSLSLFRELGDGQGTAHALQNLGRASAFQGDYEQAIVLLEEGLSLARKVGAVVAIGLCLETLGEVALLQHQDYAHATRNLHESLKIFHRLGLKGRISSSFELLASAALLMNLPERVARLGGAAQRLHDEMGNWIMQCELPYYEQTVSQARTQLPPKVFTALWKQGYELNLEQAIGYALEPVSPSLVEGSLSQAEAAPVPATPVPAAQKLGLSVREVAVLKLVMQGLTNAEVAEKLSISPHTVNSHLTSIYAKLEVSSRVEAIHTALQHHLV